MMTDLSSHSYHSNNSLQDLFDSSLNRFLDEPGHLSALEIVLNDSSYLNDGRLQSSNGSLLFCQESNLLNVSSSSCDDDPEIANATDTIIALKEDLEEIKKLKEMKLQLERDLKAKKERKKRRAQKKKRSGIKRDSNEEDESPEHDVSILKSKEDSDQEKSPKKIKDELNHREKTERDHNRKTSPRISKKESHKEAFLKQNQEESRQDKSHTKRKKKESITIRELYTDTGSLLLEGYIQVNGNRRRHSSHERTTPFPEFTTSDLMETDEVKESGSKRSVVDQSNPRQEKRRHSVCDITRKAPARCTSCPIQEITIVKMSKKDTAKMEVSLIKKEHTKTKSKDEEGNNKDNRKVKQVKNEKSKQESSPKATKIKEVTTTEAELNALKDRETLAASAPSKKERLKKFEEERGSSASPRIRSKKKPGLSNKPPPKCILDALNWATRNGLFGVNHDQTRRARMIAAHRRDKFDELVGQYDRGVILRRHSVSS